MYVSGWLLCCHEPKYLQVSSYQALSGPKQDDNFLPGLDSLQRQMTIVLSSCINHNKGAENARRQMDTETGQNVQRLMTTTPRTTSL